jgi:hypothetical protein
LLFNAITNGDNDPGFIFYETGKSINACM